MDLASLKTQLDQVLELLKSDIGKIRTGRATPALVESIIIPAYGGQQMLKLQELATITAQDAQTLVITPYDPSIAGDIRKGIVQANVGLNPILEAETIRIALPPLTTERREEYIKLLNTKLENGKIMARQVRQEVMKHTDDQFAAKTISEDEKFRLHEEIQRQIDKTIEEIETIGRAKEQELRQV